MAQNPPAGTPQVFPRLAYRDPTAAVAWLTREAGARIEELKRALGQG